MSGPDLERRFRAGHADALGALVAAYQDPVYALCHAWLASAERAETAAAEVFIDLRDHRRAPSPPRIVIFRLAATRCALQRPTPARGPDRPERWLFEALARLDAPERAVLLLRDIAGLDLDEIAEVLDLARGSVRARLQRARLKLGDHLWEVS